MESVHFPMDAILFPMDVLPFPMDSVPFPMESLPLDSTPFPNFFAFQAWIIPPDFDHSEAEAKVKELLCKHLFNMHLSALGI